MVLQWDGAQKDAEKEVVILNTDQRSDVFVGFDAYDDRSLIENQCNREALKKHENKGELVSRTSSEAQ